MDKQSDFFPLVAIIVTYNPDLAVLGRLVDQCLPQVDAIVLVDNGEGQRLSDWLVSRVNVKITLLPLGQNKGIATAQNIGIEWARNHGAERVLIFDHDSDPPRDLVSRLQGALTDLEGRGQKIAAVGPRYTDSRWKEEKQLSPFVRFKGLRLVRCYPHNNSGYVPVDFLIASGSLISMKALDALGGMRDELFIDYVDIEWGLRARYAGWSLYGVWDVVMQHNLGDAQVAILGREFVTHSASRHYYLIRNALWLCCQPGFLWRWKVVLGYNAFKKFVAYSLFMPKPLDHFLMMCRGFGHGLIGRMGRL